MKITFAVKWTDPATKVEHLPDSSDEIDDAAAKTLLHDGYARKFVGDVKPAPAAEPDPVPDDLPGPPPKSGKGSGLQAWIDYASAHGVAVPDGADKAEIADLLTAAGKPTE